MSRTQKDKPHEIRFPYRWDHDTHDFYTDPVLVTTTRRLNLETMEFEVADLESPYLHRHFRRLQTPTTKPKRRREVDTEDHWMSTPSWWTNMKMNRPARHKGRTWERKVLVEDLEETDPPGVSHKPHIYWW
jgi:hypothetical protein